MNRSDDACASVVTFGSFPTKFLVPSEPAIAIPELCTVHSTGVRNDASVGMWPVLERCRAEDVPAVARHSPIPFPFVTTF